jgi:translation initiation factor 2B subunit (eIF-2B alpha/beta/delta family)
MQSTLINEESIQQVEKSEHEELLDKINALENSLINVRKAESILDTLTGDYAFIPQDNDKKQLSTTEWVYDRERIIRLIDIVCDYVIETRKEISKALGDT